MMPPLCSCESTTPASSATRDLRLGVTMSAVEAVVLIAVGTAAAIAWAMFSKPSGGATLRVSGEARRGGYKERGRPGARPMASERERSILASRDRTP
jgi:hypothetical protein